nr:immunoglobulin light chain junction region [Macaca mulatta]MOV82607.1 immunoglobulin light chain junction region [Macaca mulatta]
CQQHNGNPPTF